MGFANIQEVAHEVETLLDSARQERLTITPEVIDVVLASADHLKRELDRLQQIAAGNPHCNGADLGEWQVWLRLG